MKLSRANSLIALNEYVSSRNITLSDVEKGQFLTGFDYGFAGKPSPPPYEHNRLLVAGWEYGKQWRSL